ncbi:MAG: cystathionine gamma-synthase family protein [Gemmatimonadetes bacterium]|nr:cystathionine gamma-synthase family protein [Gemmatimonadota bacterium]
MDQPHQPGPGTTSVWAGEELLFPHGITTVPLHLGVTYGFETLEAWRAVALGQAPGHIYGRSTNPTTDVFEAKICALEGAEAAVSFASGMAAVSNLFATVLSPGDRVVSIRDTYGGTSKLFLETLPRQGISVVLVETADHEALEREVAAGCRLLYLETPTNPTLKILDVRRLAAAAHRVGALVAVDNTFATPINQRPLALGADAVLHSATKYLGGHSDAIGGVLCGGRELMQRVFSFREVNGAVMHPMSAYLILRGMKTLELRVQRQNASAESLSRFLSAHPAVAEVFYPGLPDHPQHAIARSQMSGFGGVLSFALRAGDDAVGAFLARLRYVHLAASLGSVSTLAGPPSTTSHVEITAAQRRELGIPEGLVRYAVGIENVEDLQWDLDQALNSL